MSSAGPEAAEEMVWEPVGETKMRREWHLVNIPVPESFLARLLESRKWWGRWLGSLWERQEREKWR